MSKGQSLQDPFLNALRKDRIPVSIFLVNGIKLQGQIESFDQYVVLLKNTVSQMVYKHAISTVVPTRNPRTEGAAASGFSGVSGGGAMATGAAPSSFGGGFATQDRSFNNRPAGGFSRSGQSGFERSGFDKSFDKGGFENRGFGGSMGGFDRNTTGFERSFDRTGFEERGFDGKTFEQQELRGFNRSGFDASELKFADDEFDYDR